MPHTRPILRCLGGLCLGILFTLGLAAQPGRTIIRGTVSPGLVDLRTWNPTEQKVIDLEEGWLFVWQELLHPGDLNPTRLGQLQSRTRPLSAAQRWTQPQDRYSNLPVYGYGSYYLKILLPPDHPPLAIDLKPIGSAARIYWNNQEIASFGKPGTSPQTTHEMVGSQVVSLPESDSLDPNSVTLLIQVANWSDNMPGLEMIPRIGVLRDLQFDRERSIAITSLMTGLFLVMCIYHICLFLFRRKDLSPLLFAFICFLLAWRILVTDDLHIHVLFPVDSLHFIIGGSYLTYALLIFMFVLFITDLFRFGVGPILRWVSGISCGAFSLFVIIAPPGIFTQYLSVLQIMSLVLGSSMIALLVIAIIQRKPNSLLFLAGFLCVMIAATHDILKVNLQWGTPSLVPVGIVAFVFFQSLVVIRKSTLAIIIAEKLSTHLQKVNTSMARFVPREILVYLERQEITDIQLGDNSLQNMSVLFADIKAFSRISESLSPESTFKLINRFLAVIGPIIRNHGGFVDKYLGDGIMALFPGDASSAIQAGLDMQKGMAKVNAERIRLGQELIAIGIGIHYGPLMLGTIGEPQRMDSTVISDAVNLASRLQGLTRQLGGQVLVSEATLHQLANPDNFHFRNLGVFKVYNRQETVAVTEFFDSESQELWERKRQTRRNFERAVNLYQLNQTAQAKEAFLAHLTIFPDDLAAQYYLDRLTTSVET